MLEANHYNVTTMTWRLTKKFYETVWLQMGWLHKSCNALAMISRYFKWFLLQWTNRNWYQAGFYYWHQIYYNYVNNISKLIFVVQFYTLQTVLLRLLSTLEVYKHVCVCVYLCAYVFMSTPRILTTSGMMWHNMDPIWLVKQVL